MRKICERWDCSEIFPRWFFCTGLTRTLATPSGSKHCTKTAYGFNILLQKISYLCTVLVRRDFEFFTHETRQLHGVTRKSAKDFPKISCNRPFNRPQRYCPFELCYSNWSGWSLSLRRRPTPTPRRGPAAPPAPVGSAAGCSQLPCSPEQVV
jgi:hypothetical protein